MKPQIYQESNVLVYKLVGLYTSYLFLLSAATDNVQMHLNKCYQM